MADVYVVYVKLEDLYYKRINNNKTQQNTTKHNKTQQKTNLQPQK